MSEPVRVAVVGCGWAGMRHAQAYLQSGAEIRWAVDVDRQRAETLGRLDPHAQAHADYHRALDDPQVDVVDICLPHNLHGPVGVAALQAGKHVLCEKPLAASLEQADRLIAAAEAARRVLMVSENVRFEPIYQRVRDLLRAGVIGQPALVQMTRQCYLAEAFLRDRPWFLNRQAAAGGIMMSGGIHDVETMRMLVGEISGVHALRARQRFREMEGDDTSVALFQFANGAVGTLVESFCMKSLTTASGREVHTLRVDGELGSLEVDGGRTIRVFSEHPEWSGGGASDGTLRDHQLYVPPGDTFRELIAHFIICVRTGVEPLTSGRSQRRPLEVVLAAYRSMETGQPMAL